MRRAAAPTGWEIEWNERAGKTLNHPSARLGAILQHCSSLEASPRWNTTPYNGDWSSCTSPNPFRLKWPPRITSHTQFHWAKWIESYASFFLFFLPTHFSIFSANFQVNPSSSSTAHLLPTSCISTSFQYIPWIAIWNPRSSTCLLFLSLSFSVPRSSFEARVFHSSTVALRETTNHHHLLYFIPVPNHLHHLYVGSRVFVLVGIRGGDENSLYIKSR